MFYYVVLEYPAMILLPIFIGLMGYIMFKGFDLEDEEVEWDRKAWKRFDRIHSDRLGTKPPRRE